MSFMGLQNPTDDAAHDPIHKAAMTEHRICTISVIIKKEQDSHHEKFARLLAESGFKCCWCEGKLDFDTLALARRHDWATLLEKTGTAPTWGVCRACYVSLRTKKPCPFKRHYSVSPGGKHRLILEHDKDPPHI